jgi:small subunit ribosomal protein S2
VIDVRREITALREARKLGIPTICLIDTDGDPEHADIAIPGNDDSMRSIDVVVRELCLAVAEGRQQRQAVSAAEGASGGDAPAAEKPRRSSRSQFKAAGEEAASTN